MKFIKLFKNKKNYYLALLFIMTFTGLLAQNNKLSIHRKETTIIQVFTELEKKSDYVFFFSDDVKTELSQRVSISATDKPLKKILDEVLEETLLDYKIVGRQITISHKVNKSVIRQNKKTKNVKINGVVTDADSKEPLANVNIYIPELGRGASTGEDGAFSITIPNGTYSFRLSYIGYKTGTEKVDASLDINSCIFSLRSDTKLEEVVVLANKKDENVTRTNMGVEKLTISEIRRMPALMGEVDIIKAIQLLPGVQATAEGGSGYSVRGGSADQNLIVLDNATVYNASHMFGFFSVFNNDVVDNVELYKGDLPLKYGGRLPPLLDVQL